MKIIFSFFIITLLLGPQILFAQVSLATPVNNLSTPSFDQKAWIDFIRNFYYPRVSRTMFIEQISPSFGSSGTVVTISGRGFNKTANRVYTGYGLIEGVPSWDGKHLIFKINFLSGAMGNAMINAKSNENSKVKAMRIPLWLYVENETGISNNRIFWFQFDPFKS